MVGFTVLDNLNIVGDLPAVKAGNLEFDIGNGTVTIKGRVVRLTATEQPLLRNLIRTGSVDATPVQISRLRTKLANAGWNQTIRAVARYEIVGLADEGGR